MSAAEELQRRAAAALHAATVRVRGDRQASLDLTAAIAHYAEGRYADAIELASAESDSSKAVAS